jgi:hypothetical protein
MIHSGNLMSIKYYIKYWKHFSSKKQDLTLKLNTVLLLNQANTIKNNYNVYKLII